MMTKAVENQIAKWLYIGAPAVALLVTSTISYDPVNVSKLLLGSVIGFACLALALTFGLKTLWQQTKWPVIASVLFVLASLIALFTSTGPKAMSFYGVFGRNTGFLCYMALLGTFLASLLLRDVKNFKKILWGLFTAGAINVAYCALALSGHDLIKWNNIYNAILGTFGNPDFISAFLGIFTVGILAYVFGGVKNWPLRIAFLILAAVAVFEIKKSHAIQGLAVTGLGIAIIGFYLLRSKFKNVAASIAYLASVGFVGVVALAGTLQMGPLAKYVYKTSVSLRGEYWRAGIKMGMDHPLTGVGYDTYGDWYRRTRDAGAMILPGPKVVTNAAHNVVIDIFASGGFPLLIAYLALFVLTIISILKVTLRNRTYDPVFVALTTAWVCYEVQSVISINQIGLAIWGWVFGGALIAYEIATRDGSSISEDAAPKKASAKKGSQGTSAAGYLTGFAGALAGFLIALPPFTADAAWRSAMAAKSLPQVQAAATKWPIDTFRLANIAVLVEQSKFPDQALELARKGVEYNPQSFDAWRLLASVSKSTPEEKAKATEMMHKLDPRNKKLE